MVTAQAVRGNVLGPFYSTSQFPSRVDCEHVLCLKLRDLCPEVPLTVKSFVEPWCV